MRQALRALVLGVAGGTAGTVASLMTFHAVTAADATTHQAPKRPDHVVITRPTQFDVYHCGTVHHTDHITWVFVNCRLHAVIKR